ncbi:MAG TPA: PepSY-associated TM helix domain-containing protein, partial [Cellvibrionaceae bacterium]
MSETLALLSRKLKTLPLGSVRQWHWMSSAVCLIGLLAFSITGITLNHAAQIPANLQLERRSGQLPEMQLKALNEQL